MKTFFFFLTMMTMSFSAKSAELFIRVAKQGSFTAVVYNQTQSNPLNIFRFFDLPGGQTNVQIIDQQTGNFIYNSSVYLNYNQSVTAELEISGTFKILQTLVVNPVNWYTSVYSTANGMPVGGGTGFGMFPNQNMTTTPNGYVQFMNALDKESFDSRKVINAKNYIDNNPLTAQQIADISRKFSFDSNRLDWTEYAYTKCTDKANYFVLKDTFEFTSNYYELENYMKTH